MNRVRLRVLYSGQVQGVGFRYAVRQVATGFEVAGWVRNLGDGRVELVVEGMRDELEAFRVAIGDSGVGAHIRDEVVAWEAAAGNLAGFRII